MKSETPPAYLSLYNERRDSDEVRSELPKDFKRWFQCTFNILLKAKLKF